MLRVVPSPAEPNMLPQSIQPAFIFIHAVMLAPDEQLCGCVRHGVTPDHDVTSAHWLCAELKVNPLFFWIKIFYNTVCLVKIFQHMSITPYTINILDLSKLIEVSQNLYLVIWWSLTFIDVYQCIMVMLIGSLTLINFDKFSLT